MSLTTNKKAFRMSSQLVFKSLFKKYIAYFYFKIYVILLLKTMHLSTLYIYQATYKRYIMTPMLQMSHCWL